MTKILNITNGDCAVNIMQKAELSGDFLAWRDVLHVGPVPEGLPFDALSQVRANYIIEKEWGKAEDVQAAFDERLAVLSSLAQYDKIILWFEHDLYDQLQLLEILNWFADQPDYLDKLSMVCTDNYLGRQSPQEMQALLQYEEPLSKAHLKLASAAWAAFRSPTPLAWQELLGANTSVLPFLEGAIKRMLEEYPNKKNGLSRTAQKALEIIAKGEEQRPGKIFGLYSKTEQRIFLGDTIFWGILHEMLESTPPMLSLKNNMPLLPINPEQEMTITKTGQDVLDCKQSFLDLKIRDYWIGGVHLTANNIWLWDDNTQTITAL